MASRDALPLKVYRNGVENTDLIVMTMQESAGVERLDVAHLLYKSSNLENRNFHSATVCDEIEIQRTDTNEVLHWGKVSIVPPLLNPDTEQLIIVSRTEKFHIGGRVEGIYVWNPIQPSEGGGDPVGGAELINHEMIFNPIIDGKLYGNANDTNLSETTTPYQLFLDPESIRTTAAASLNDDAAAVRWTIADALHYLLWTLNADETYITNTAKPTIEAAFTAADEDGFQNVHIPLGTYLADALDMILEPLGYRWRIHKTAIGARTFQFYNRNAGDVVYVHHQPLGSELDTTLQNVEAAGLQFDVSNLFNQVTILGGFRAYEVTVELARGWAEKFDDTPEADLAKDAEGFENRRDAWRRWVLNEAGDYIGLRSEIDGVFTSAFRTALEGEFGPTIWNELVPRRRGWQPTLTLGDDLKPIGDHHGVRLEYLNTAHEEGKAETGPEWKPIGNWGAQLIENECAVYFDGQLPPLEEKFGVIDRANIRLRATFTLVSDKRLEGSVTRDTDSPQTAVVPLLVDAPTKFRHQEVSALSQYYGTSRPSNHAIDSTAIQDFAGRVRDVWDLMDVGGALQLEGLDAAYSGTPYKVGQRVAGILGKELSFEAKVDSEEYPQIVAIERNVQQQTMTLHLQRVRRLISFGGDTVKNGRLGRRGRRQ